MGFFLLCPIFNHAALRQTDGVFVSRTPCLASGLTVGVWFTSSRSGPCLSRSRDSQGSDPGHPAPLVMHSVACGGRCSQRFTEHLHPSGEAGVHVQWRSNDSTASLLPLLPFQDYYSPNDHVLIHFTPNLGTKRAIRCPFLAAVFPVQSYW